jgi:hypothetical protein
MYIFDKRSPIFLGLSVTFIVSPKGHDDEDVDGLLIVVLL